MLKKCLTCQTEFESKSKSLWCTKECKALHAKKCREEASKKDKKGTIEKCLEFLKK